MEYQKIRMLMSKRRHDSEVVALGKWAGFGPANTYAVILPEAYWNLSEQKAIIDQVPCMLDCDDKDCMEWSDVFWLPGNTRKEAIANLIQGNWSGVSYHVSECEMHDEIDIPDKDKPVVDFLKEMVQRTHA